MNFTKESFDLKNALTSLKENAFKKFIYKKINVITFAKEIFHEYKK